MVIHKILTVIWHLRCGQFSSCAITERYFHVFKNKNVNTAQKMKFSIKNFFSKCNQIRRLRRIWSYSLKKSLRENFIFCAVKERCNQNMNFIVFKYFDNYLNNAFVKGFKSSLSLRNWYHKLKKPFGKTNKGQNALSI